MFAVLVSMAASVGLLAGAAGTSIHLPLEPIYLIDETNGAQRVLTSHGLALHKIKSGTVRPAFMAVCTNVWLPGLVPIFEVEKTNHFELRRRPPHGHENISEPLFFALPLDDENDAEKLAGRWQLDAVRNGSRIDFALELTSETNVVAGRFDQYTEYRFANLMGGTLASNILRLRVEYANDVYLLTSVLHNNQLNGDWRRDDNSESGTWKATRPPAIRIPETNLVELWEWRQDANCRYEIASVTVAGNWRRSPRALCRVWRN